MQLKNIISLSCLLFSLSVISCAKQASDQQEKKDKQENKNFVDLNPNLTNELNTIIASKLNQFNYNCDRQNVNILNDNFCSLVDVEPGFAPIKEESNGLRVLIIDDESMKLSAYTRYRNRVLENIKETDEGEFVTDNSTIKIPIVAKNILIDIFNNDRYDKIPYELTQNSSQLFNALDTYTIGHGNYIFNYIANNSPNSQFVVAYNKLNSLENILNSNLNDNAKLKNIDTLFRNKVIPLSEVETSTSNATPIAVSYLLYLKSENPHFTKDDILNHIKNLKGDGFILLDPVFHRQHPIYSLGLLRQF